MNSAEATEVFFGVTKLFMSDDASLRRMVYLFIKDVAETCNPDDVIIVTSSLTKDMTCDVDLYRANALRVLARIVDAAMLGAIERYVKQAVVDSSGQVSSAALVSATHLFERNEESAGIVKRWISETTEATSSPNEMVQVSYLILVLAPLWKLGGGAVCSILLVFVIFNIHSCHVNHHSFIHSPLLLSKYHHHYLHHQHPLSSVSRNATPLPNQKTRSPRHAKTSNPILPTQHPSLPPRPRPTCPIHRQTPHRRGNRGTSIWIIPKWD